jgi:hypothetical protein
MPEFACPARVHLDASFESEICYEDKPAHEAVRVGTATPAHHVDLCRGCHRDGVADGMIDPTTQSLILPNKKAPTPPSSTPSGPRFGLFGAPIPLPAPAVWRAPLSPARLCEVWPGIRRRSRGIREPGMGGV